MSALQTQNPVIKWIEYRMPIFSFIDHAVGSGYPAPRNLSYWWNFGSIAGVCLMIQIVTGIVLAMFYTPHTDMAFDSVERIMRDVNYGWLLRYLHSNGASLFFLAVYIHIFRGLYYGSYKAPRELLWWLGIILLLLMMGAAFMGYVLPWGQLSFWAAKVITTMFTAVPIVGQPMVEWLWGGFNVDNPTLNRFYSLHYLLPFLIVGVVVLHIWALHVHGSNNPLGIDTKGPQDKLSFHPYYTVKDLFGFGVFFIVYAVLVFYAPNLVAEPINYEPANFLVTPSHITPEWYFLPFYAILRSVPDIFFISAKLAGVIAMLGAILILFLVPWLDTSRVRSGRFRPIFKQFFWLLVIDTIILGWVGANPPEGIFIVIGRVATAYYFLHFIVILPIVGLIERPKPLPESISEPVLKGGGGAAAPQPAQDRA